MKILKTSIIPAVSFLSLAFLGVSYGVPASPALQDYTGSGNNVVNSGTLGAVSGTSAFGIRFNGVSGSSTVVVNSNTFTNNGVIYSGGTTAVVVAAGAAGSAAVVFDGAGGQVNANTVVNNGALFDVSPGIGAGIALMSTGTAAGNTVQNKGLIQISGSNYAAGIGIQGATVSSNSVLNSGTIGVTGERADGLILGGLNGVTGNTVVNTGAISVNVTGSAMENGGNGISVQSGTSGAITGNVITNAGSISLASNGEGIDLSGIRISMTDDEGASADVIGNRITNSGSIQISGSNGSAYGLDVYPIYGSVSGNTFTNSGTISIDFSDGQVYGVSIYPLTSVTGNTIVNSGNLFVGGTNISAYGVNLDANDGDVQGNFIRNSGVFSVTGDTAYGVTMTASGAVSGNVIDNSGRFIVSGSNSRAYGITLSGSAASGNNISNSGSLSVSATNSTAYGITFGNDGPRDAMMLMKARPSGVANGNAIANTGSFQVSGYDAYGINFGGEGSSGNTFVNRGLFSVQGSYNAQGIFFNKGEGSADGNVIVNYGTFTISGGDSYGIYFGEGYDESTSNGNVINNFGTLSVVSTNGWDAYGIAFDDGGASDGNVINNFGTLSVSGSNSWNVGIYFDTDGGSANNNVINNYGKLIASGANGSSYGMLFESDGGPVIGNVINNYGTISASGDEAYGIYFDGEGSPINNNRITNYGVITASGNSYAVGIGIYGSEGGATGNVITNYGTITVSGSNAAGIYLSGSSNGNVIINHGAISASGPRSAAIYIESGDNNVITLTGHSSVQGLIAASGSNNVLNIALTGVSKKEAKELRHQLGAALNGAPSSGTFTVRGVTYVYDPLIVNMNVSSYADQGRTPNQKAIGANLDSFSVDPRGDMLRLLDSLDSSRNVPAALEALSPQRYQVYGDIALANADLLTQEVDQRLNNLRSGSEGFDASGLGVSSGSIQNKLGMGDRKQVVSSGKDGKAQIEQTDENRWGAFLSGDVVFANIDGRAWQQDSNFTNAGLVAGVDAKLTDALTSGLLFGYNHSDVDLDSHNSNANVDAYTGGLFSGYHEGNYYGNGLFTYTRNNYESDRNITGFGRSANGRTSGSQYVANLDGGYDHPVAKDLTVGPFAGLQYVHMDVNSFTENGAGAANLAINDQAMDSLRSRLGVRLELRKEVTPSWKVASEVRVAWMHEFANNDRAIVARFSGSGLSSFAVRTNDAERDAALIGLGLNATYRDTLTSFVDYDVEAGQAHYVEQIVKGGFKWSF